MIWFCVSDSFSNTSMSCLSLRAALLLWRVSSQEERGIVWNVEKNGLRSYRLPQVSWVSLDLGT